MSENKSRLFDKLQHLWFEEDDDTLVVGISDYAQDQLGEILFVELPEMESFSRDDYLMCIESGKKEQELFAPFDLTVIEVNEDLDDQPDLINENAYENWIFKAKIENPEDLDELSSYDDYHSEL